MAFHAPATTAHLQISTHPVEREIMKFFKREGKKREKKNWLGSPFVASASFYVQRKAKKMKEIKDETFHPQVSHWLN